MQGTELGVVLLGQTLAAAVPIGGPSGAPADPATAPNYRVYGQAGLMAQGTGSLSKLDTGAISNASNASPIVITSAAHGLQTGTPVVISGVAGNAAANGTFRVTRLSADTFSLDGSTGDGPYTAGGSWHVAGLYLLSFAVTGGLGYLPGGTYQALINWRIGGTDYAMMCPFRVA